jgi:sodium-dependent dicarboxylate transporter 2/3/5
MAEARTTSTGEGAGVASAAAQAGRFLGPLCGVLVYVALRTWAADLGPAAHATAAVGVLMAIWWMTEALPLPATALVPIVAFPLLGVASVKEAAAPFADPVIFLFMGGFLLAIAMQRWGLHKRIALGVVLLAGTGPRRLVAGFMIATAFLSMWLSNTATTLMMLPIALSVVTLTMERLIAAGDPLAVDERGKARPLTGTGSLHFATCLMLGVAYAASIGGVGTLIGTPPNAFLRAFVEREYGVEIGFGRWMILGVPLVVLYLVIAWVVLTFIAFPIRLKAIPGGRALIRDELDELGPMSRGEKIVLGAFGAAALLWITREPLTKWDWLTARAPFIERLDDTVIAIGAGLFLFACPVSFRRREFVLRWDDAVRLPWGVLLLFGGGLSLAVAVKGTGLDGAIGGAVGGLAGYSPWLILAAVTALVIFLSEVTSNTATAATFLPIVGGVALATGNDPGAMLTATTLAATCAFMLPVGTPPNAIVFGTGHVRTSQMIRAGIVLNLLGIAIIPLAVRFLAPLALPEIAPGPATPAESAAP